MAYSRFCVAALELKMSQAAVGANPAKTEQAGVSPAELKKKAKAEKQARRAAQKEQQPEVGVATKSGNGESRASLQDDGSQHRTTSEEGNALPKERKSYGSKAKGSGNPKKQSRQGDVGSQEGETPQKDGPAPQQTWPDRRRLSQLARPQVVEESRQVGIVSHLYTQPRRHHIEGASKDVHPTVLALGLQMSSYEICGSSARCVAMLLAFKAAIQEYTTPSGTSLARHMTSHHLSPQIDYLKSCRPLSESMGNAVRWLKKLIVETDPSTPDTQAKDDLCESIDTFIHERFGLTASTIVKYAKPEIKPGSVVLTYAKSAVVQRMILEAHGEGIKFRVIVIGSLPLLEGKYLAETLMKKGLDVEYLPYSAIAYAIKYATVVFLGAHAMLSNGNLQSRIGTASLAMQANQANIPVIVLCESVKFSAKVPLDSIVLNEVAPAEELLLLSPSQPGIFSPNQGHGGGIDKSRALQNGKDSSNLQVLNLMYDMTPMAYISMVICEYGCISPASVPVVHRLANEAI